MRNELTIKGFVNEMSYDLTMQELETVVLDYQETLIDFFVNNQYNYKMKREFNEVCEIIRGDRFFKTISALINSEDSRVIPDMAYVLYTATHHIEDKGLITEAIMLGHDLRILELGDVITGNKETDMIILFQSVKTVRSYEVTAFFRTKEVENILENLAEMMHKVYNGKYTVSAINENVISTILFKTVPDLQLEEFVSACCKTDLPKDMDERFKPYATRIQSFAYKVCGMLDQQKFDKALSAACNSIDRFNNRTGSNETLMGRYLNYRLLKAVVSSKDVEVPELMKVAYSKLKDFKDRNQKYKHLF